MALSVIKAGLLDTIQDMGRNHYGGLGINAGGTMDTYAAQLANMLVGNCSTEALMELHFPGPQILFEQNALIAITGGDFFLMLDDVPIPVWQPIVLRKNTVLHFPKLVNINFKSLLKKGRQISYELRATRLITMNISLSG